MAKYAPKRKADFNAWTAINQKFFSSLLEAGRDFAAGSADLESLRRAQLGAARTAVEDTLALERAAIAEWKSRLPEGTGSAGVSQIALTALESGIEFRKGLWEMLFSAADRADALGVAAGALGNMQALLDPRRQAQPSAPTQSAPVESAAAAQSKARPF